MTSKSNLKKLIRKIIKKGDEYDKVEVKSYYNFSQKKDRIRLVKCIAAIANSDSTYFENYGYIVLGAKRGKLVGGFEDLEKDSTSANIHNWVRSYVEPKVNFSVERFKDSKVGWWGVIVIPPTFETHVFRKEYSETNLNIRRGDVYVRDGDSIILAEKSDHDRLQRRKFQNTIDELKNKITTLEQKIEEDKAIQPALKLFFIDDRNNQHDMLEVQPIFIEKTDEQCLLEVSKAGGIKRIENDLKELDKDIESNKGVELTVSPEALRKFIKLDELETYKKELTEYLEKLKKYSVAYRKYESLFLRSIRLSFVLLNDGYTLAEGIKFYINFPTDLKLSDEIDFFRPPEFLEKKPRDPRRSSISDLLTPRFGPLGVERFPIPNISPQTYGGPAISKKKDSIQVSYWSNKLLQNHTHNFAPIYLLSPDNDRDIDLIYNIYAENIPGTSKGTLKLKIRPKK